MIIQSFSIESKIEDFSLVQLNLDLIWKSENGNRGHIQYSQIRPKLPPKGIGWSNLFDEIMISYN